MNDEKMIFKNRLNHRSIFDLKVILEICEEKGKTDIKWQERAELVEEVLLAKINYIFCT